MSSFLNFLTTYKRVLKIAYQVSPSLLILVIVLNSLWGLTNLPVLYVNKLLIDTVIAGTGSSDIIGPLKIIGLLLVVRTLIELLRYVFSNWNNALRTQLSRLSNKYIAQILGEKLNSLDIPTIESPQFQDKYKKIEREYGRRFWGLIWPVAQIPDALFTIVSGLIPILTFNPIVSIIAIIGAIPQMFSNSKLVKYEYQILSNTAPKWRVWSWVFYFFTSLKNIYENKILGVSSVLKRKLNNLEEEILNEEFRFDKMRVKYSILTHVPELLLSSILNGYFFMLAILQKISLGSAQMLYGATNTLSNGTGSLVGSIGEIQQNYQFIDDLLWLIDLKPKFGETGKTPKKRFTQGIEFNHVWFKYPNSKKWVLKNVSFFIHPSENIAVVGENGAGKTTLIKLLCGFYQPNKGVIKVDGEDISSYKHSSYIKHIAALFQDFYEYSFSARESIGYGNISALESRERIRSAAKLSEIHNYIAGLEKGYDTPLNKEFEGGTEPSKGQWQRIALARTIFRDSQITILDEPTSNVDAKAEEDIFSKLIRLTKDRMLVLISHRFSTVRRADKILLLENGKITEQGSHEQLMKLDGKYAHLFNLQAKSYQ